MYFIDALLTANIFESGPMPRLSFNLVYNLKAVAACPKIFMWLALVYFQKYSEISSNFCGLLRIYDDLGWIHFGKSFQQAWFSI